MAYGTCDDLRAKQTDKLYLDPWVSADLVFHFPAVGNANVGYRPADDTYTNRMVPIIGPLISAEYLPSAMARQDRGFHCHPAHEV